MIDDTFDPAAWLRKLAMHGDQAGNRATFMVIADCIDRRQAEIKRLRAGRDEFRTLYAHVESSAQIEIQRLLEDNDQQQAEIERLRKRVAELESRGEGEAQ